MPNAQKIPWPRIAVEGVAIIASILIAFSIDAWWANRLERAEESELLASLQDELQINVGLIESSLEVRQAIFAAATELLEASAKNVQIPSAELDQRLGTLIWGNTSDLSTGVLFNLVQGGKLDLVEQKPLRSRIASLSARYDWSRQLEQLTLDTLKDSLYPYLFKNAVLAQLQNAQSSAPGTVGSPIQPAIPIGASRDHQYLMNDDEFIGIVTRIYGDQWDVIVTLTPLREILRALIVEIDTTLANK